MTITINPAVIEEHPLLANLPRWAATSADLDELANDIGAHGMHQALIAIKSGEKVLLVDGRHRLAAAIMAGLPEVPVIFVHESEALHVILGTLVQRRHYTKSGLAYVTWPLFAPRSDKKGGDRKSAKAKSKPNDSVLILKEIANQIGVSEDLVGFAKAAHELFTERPDLREKFEPAILAGELSLNRLPGAVAGRDSTIGKSRTNPEPTQLLFQGFDALKTRFARWEKIAEGDRTTIAAEWVRTVYDLPDDVQRKTYESLRAKFQ